MHGNNERHYDFLNFLQSIELLNVIDHLEVVNRPGRLTVAHKLTFLGGQQALLAWSCPHFDISELATGMACSQLPML